MRLEDITIGRYIDVQCGDLSALGNSTDPDKEARSLSEEYYSIVNPSSVKIRISKNAKRLKMNMRRQCAMICLAMAESGNYSSAIEIMNEIGYSCTERDVKDKANGVIAECRYLLDRMDSEQYDNQSEQTPEQVRASYTRERAFLMTYNKMYIDKNTMSAAEYAYIVAQTKEDIDARMAVCKKK